MKKILLILCLGTIGFHLSYAQSSPQFRGGEKGSMAESLKIAYITKQLNLNTLDAEKFWPVYNTYIAEIKKARKANIQIADPLLLEEQILNIRKKYKESFKKILGSDERANKLFIAENEYGRMVKKEWQSRMQRHNKPMDNHSAEKDGAPNPPPTAN